MPGIRPCSLVNSKASTVTLRHFWPSYIPLLSDIELQLFHFKKKKIETALGQIPLLI